jgi:hypothetical protein
VPSEKPQDPLVATDEALANWRQGDCVLGEHWFVHRVDLAIPLTDAGRHAAAASSDLAETAVAGLVVVSQTCDIVRACKDRSFAEVSPLVEVSPQDLALITGKKRPSYALVPSLASQRLVADLDRTMTVEKPVIAGWIRVAGCRTDEEGRAFAEALARKRKRFAFPDDFNALVRPLQARLVEKHGRDSDEGRSLRALREIRIQATPSWSAENINLMIWFIPYAENAVGTSLPTHIQLESWLKLIKPSGRFRRVHGQIETLERLRAVDYLASDLLDLDHLSSG